MMVVVHRPSFPASWFGAATLGLVLLAAVATTTTAAATAATIPLVYSFTTQSCHHFQSVLPDSSSTLSRVEGTTAAASTTHGLVRNPNTTSCHGALGVVVSNSNISGSNNNSNPIVDENYYYVTSHASSKELLGAIRNANQGISFALWIKPDLSSFAGPQSRPILTVGKRKRIHTLGSMTRKTMGGLNECDDNQLDFQLSQRNKSLEIWYRTSESIFEPCQYYQVSNMIPYTTTKTIANGGGGEEEDQQRNLLSLSSSSTSVPILVPGKLVHVVVSLFHEHQLVFINGHSVASLPLTRPFSNSLDHWHVNEQEEDDDDDDVYGLHLFAYSRNNNNQQDDNNAWLGTIYQLTIDVGHQTESTVQATLLRTGGLPLSEPWANNFTIRMQEDAEAVAGSNAPEWYRNPAPIGTEATAKTNSTTTTTIGRIPLLFESIDQQVYDLLLANGVMIVNTTNDIGSSITNSNVNTTTTTTRSNSHGPTFLTYVTKLPEVGNLYLTDGTRLEGASNGNDGMVNLFPVRSDHQVVYIPPLNAYSNKNATTGLLDVFASFDFCVSKRPIINAQQCPSATVHIVVKPVNDPPIAVWTASNNKNNHRNYFVVSEGIETLSTPKIHLGGTDVDPGDSILQVQITQPPLYGRLILSVGSFRQDRIRHGTDVAELQNIIRGRDPIHVKYIFEPSLFSGAVQGTNTKDSFRFRVADQHSRWSAEESVSIQISSAVKVVNQIVHLVSEDSQQLENVILNAHDASGYTNRRLAFYIESIPSVITQGVLVDPTTNVTLQVGSILSTMNSATMLISNASVSIPITFIPAPNYCTTHSKEKNKSVQFQIRAIAIMDAGLGGSGGDNTHIVSVSDPVTQFVQVECTMDNLSLNVPVAASDETYRLLQSTLRRFPEDSCRGDIFDPLLHTTTTDDDFATQCPRAAIFQGITVTSKDLHQQLVRVSVHAGTAGFLTFNKNFWNLTRPIYGRRAMTAGLVSFYAFPMNLTSIFSHLHFQSYRVGADQVHIVMLYGNCTHLLQSDKATTEGDTNDAVSILETWNAWSSSSTCQVLRHSIPVLVEKDEKADHYTTSLVPTFPWQLFVCLLLYPTIYYIFVQIDRFWCRGADHEDEDDHTTIVGSPYDDDNNSSHNENDDSNEMSHHEDNMEWQPDWIQHQTANGDFYYENTNDGSVTWMAPVGQQFVPFREAQDDEQENEEEKDEII